MFLPPPPCESCADLTAFWAQVGQHHPGQIFTASCADSPAVCARAPPEMRARLAAGQPEFGAWDGEQFARYTGPRNPQGVYEDVRRCDEEAGMAKVIRQQQGEVQGADAHGVKRSGAEQSGVAEGGVVAPGRRLPIPVESTELPMEEFRRRYVDTGTPVILRRPAGAAALFAADVAWLRAHCGAGPIHVFEREREGRGWAGFGGDVKMPLSTYLDRVDGSAAAGDEGHYGSDMRARCDCAALLEAFEMPRLFLRDVLPLDAALPRANWPAVIVGPGGSSSALHVDSMLLPFWLQLMSGAWRTHPQRSVVSTPAGVRRRRVCSCTLFHYVHDVLSIILMLIVYWY